MAIQYNSVRLILDRILRHPLLQEVTLESAVDYTIDFIRIVGMPEIFLEKSNTIIIDNYRGMLPIDFHQMVQVRSAENYSCAYRYSSDSFHLSGNTNHFSDPTYKIQGGIIYTSTKDTPIEIIYQSIAVDECGYPMIPDNSSFNRALELYIKKQVFTVLFDMGKINPAVLQNTQQEYAWAVGDCESEFNRLTIDKMESLCNSWRTLLVRDNQHSQGFSTNGTKEIIIKH